jgi:hypothetical protein
MVRLKIERERLLVGQRPGPKTSAIEPTLLPGPCIVLESVRKDQTGLHSFRSMKRLEARRKNARPLRLRFSQSLARRRPDHYRAKAGECEQSAEKARDPTAKREFAALARQWQALAEQAERQEQ